MKRAAIVAMGALVTAGGAMACGQILGIEEKPLRKDASAEASATDAGGADADGGAQCTAREQQGCGTCLVHDFCDDWDEGGAPASKWLLTSGPQYKGDAGAEVTDAGESAPGAFRSHVSTTTSSGYAIIGETLDFNRLYPGRTFRGIRYAFSFRVRALSFVATDGGALADKGTAALAAFINLTTVGLPQSTGVGMLVTMESLFLAASDDIRGTSGTSDRAEIFQGNVAQAASDWVRAELVMAPPEEAVARGFNRCATLASPNTPLVLAGFVLRLDLNQCLAIRPALAAGDWAKSPAFVLGTTLFDRPEQAHGEGDIEFDNVVVDFWY